MHPILPVLAGLFAAITASPLHVRAVTALNQAAFEEAHQRDDTATRAFSSIAIMTSDGKCLDVDKLSGDFRANLTPIQVKACDGSTGQQWDIITSGKHNDVARTMLLVNTLTQACMNFDPRRTAGNTVIMFSCGGRADGGGSVTNSQQFAFDGGANLVSFAPENAAGTCLAVTGAVLDQVPCVTGDTAQIFTFVGDSTSLAPASSDLNPVASFSTVSEITTETLTLSSLIATATVSPVIAAPSSAASPAVTPAGPQTGGNPTTPVPVSRAGGVLQPSAAAESNPKDDTATRAFTSASIKTSSGQCLFIDPTAGDFRQNLIPVKVQDCTGAEGEKFDFITEGVHNNVANSTLVVSSLTQCCLNFDPRRSAGDTVILFSCGGRAAGEGLVTDSQLFTFVGDNELTLAPQNGKGTTCLVPSGGFLDSASCSGDATQTFSILV